MSFTFNNFFAEPNLFEKKVVFEIKKLHLANFDVVFFNV